MVGEGRGVGEGRRVMVGGAEVGFRVFLGRDQTPGSGGLAALTVSSEPRRKSSPNRRIGITTPSMTATRSEENSEDDVMNEREYIGAEQLGNEEAAAAGREDKDGVGSGPEEHGDTATSASPLRIDILTLFPEMFTGPFDHSMISRAREAGVLEINVSDLRDWTHDRHRTTDDYAYGGGGGMVMKPEPLFEAVESILEIAPLKPGGSPPPHPVILMTPQGTPLHHELALELSRAERLVFIAGHYEGFDERVRAHLATHEISIGDFVVTGGELPAMIAVDAIARLRPGVVGHADATRSDSFAHGRLEHPHFTRPADFRGWSIPDVLVSGHHAEVDRWRLRTSLERTWRRRPELIDKDALSPEERTWIESLDDSEKGP